MGSINWIGRSAIGALSLPFLGSAALAQENAGARERLSIPARAEATRQGRGWYGSSGGGQQSKKYAGAAIIDWVTGGFELRGERLKSASKLIDTVRLGGGWRRTYAADIAVWDDAAPGITLDVGARIERTTNGFVGGPLLSYPVKTVAQMAYIGAQISGFASIRMVGFDSGGWSKVAAGQLVSRIVNGERAARRGVAMEIGGFAFRTGNARWEPQFKLRVERGRTATRSDTSATLSWKVRL